MGLHSLPPELPFISERDKKAIANLYTFTNRYKFRINGGVVETFEDRGHDWQPWSDSGKDSWAGGYLGNGEQSEFSWLMVEIVNGTT